MQDSHVEGFDVLILQEMVLDHRNGPVLYIPGAMTPTEVRDIKQTRIILQEVFLMLSAALTFANEEICPSVDHVLSGVAVLQVISAYNIGALVVKVIQNLADFFKVSSCRCIYMPG